jgi:hypothetical protein
MTVIVIGENDSICGTVLVSPPPEPPVEVDTNEQEAD